MITSVTLKKGNSKGRRTGNLKGNREGNAKM